MTQRRTPVCNECQINEDKSMNEEFETWAKTNHCLTESAWKAWQAATLATTIRNLEGRRQPVITPVCNEWPW